MLDIIYRSDLPAPFIQRFRPVLADERERGLPRYLFDRCGLDFFRRVTAGEPLVPQAVWSVVCAAHSNESLELVAGEHPDALSYVITEIGHDPQSPASWQLPRRLTLRERIRRQVIRDLVCALREAPFPVSDEVIRFIESRHEIDAPGEPASCCPF